MKVRCIKSCNNWFIAGKIYEVKNNYLTDEEKYNWAFQNLKYFNNKLIGLVKFELVKEEEEMFKVGDKVKVIKLMKDTERNTNLKIGDIGIVAEDNSKRPWITFKRGVRTDFDRGSNRWPLYEEEIQLINDKFTLSDIKERWLVVFRNGKEAYVRGYYMCPADFKVIKDGKARDEVCDIGNFNQDLTHKHDHNYDIVEVHKPHYSKVWARPTKKKYTIAEIEKLIGQDNIEIVKE